jgi:hypothetical protein
MKQVQYASVTLYYLRANNSKERKEKKTKEIKKERKNKQTNKQL